MEAIEAKTSTGELIYIEVAKSPEVLEESYETGGMIAGAEDIEESLDKLEHAGKVIAGICKTVYNEMEASLGKEEKDSKNSMIPNEITLEFGILLAGEAGIPMVSKGSVESSFKVSATWVKS